MAFDLNKQKTTKIKGFDLGKGTTKYVAPKFVEDKKVIIVPELKKVATLPAHLGGGAYNLGKPGELIITERDYPMQSETGQWREHIIPVALGGTGGDNVKMYGKEKGEEKTKYEKEQINLYKQGKISLGQARLNVLTKYQQLIGLSPTPEEMTVKGQIIPAIKDLPKTIARDGDFVPPKLKMIVDTGKIIAKTANSFLDLFKKKPALQATLTPEGKKVVQRQIQLQQQETATPIKKDFLGSLPNYYSNKENVETENNIIRAAMPLIKKEREGEKLNEDEKAFKEVAQAALENRVTAMVLNAGPGNLGEIRNGFSYIARSKNTDEIYGVIKPFFTNQADDVVRAYADDLKGITNETKVSSYLFDKLNKTDGIGLYKVVPEQASMIKALEAPIVPPVATTPKPTTPSNIPKLKIVGKEPVVAPKIITYKKPTTKMTFAEKPIEVSANVPEYQIGVAKEMADSSGAKQGNIDDETYLFIDDWKNIDAGDIETNLATKPPSQNVINRLSKYKPKESITLYRGVRNDQIMGSKTGYESWTRSKTVAKNFGNKIESRLFAPEEILVDFSKLPKWMEDINGNVEKEVIVKASPVQEADTLTQEADKVIAKSKTLEEAIDEFVKAQTNAYHGTPNKEFKEFQLGVGQNTENETRGLGVWVTPQKEAAKTFSNKIENDMFGVSSNLKDVGGTVMEVSTQMKNPKIYNSTKGLDSILEEIEKLRKEKPSALRTSPNFESDPLIREAAIKKREEISEKITKLKKEYQRDAFEHFMDDRDQFAQYIEKNAKWEDRYVAENVHETNQKFIEYLKKQGHDGIIIKGTEYDAKASGLKTIDQIVVFDPKQVLTKSQLTDIVKERWNKAQEKAVKPTPEPKKPQGEGKISEIKPTKKVSGVAKSIEAKAIEQGMIEGGFDKLADYGSSTFEEQVRKISKLMENMSEVRKIVRGEKELPNDIKSAPLLAALEKYAKVNKDYELQYELANSPLATKISEAGSELSFARMREKDSATVKLQEIKKAREAKAEKKGRNTKEAKKKIKEEMEKTNLTKEELSWDKFLDELSC